MSFSEKLKLEVKKRSGFRCVICQQIGVDVHHIIPQAEGGPDTIDNAAPLCGSCHDLFGANPEKRKLIIQMRNHWYDVIRQRYQRIIESNDLTNLTTIQVEPDNINRLKNKGIAIYHAVFENENFEDSAMILFELIKGSIKSYPKQRRVLYLDIDGHKNSNGGFDNDMFELQRYFVLELLLQYLSEVHMPLISVQNNKLQKEDIPDFLTISSDEKNLMTQLKKLPNKSQIELYSFKDDK